MVAWTLDSPRGLRAVLVAALIGVGVAFACASSPESSEMAQSSEAGAEAAVGVLTDVWVERDGDSSLVTLVGLEEPVYTAFLHDDPTALVLDLSGTEVAGPTDPQAVYDGLVEQVSFSTFDGGTDGAMTRVEISLAGNAQYEVSPGEHGLTLRLTPAAGIDEDVLAEEMPVASDEMDPWADPGMETVSAEGSELDSDPMIEEVPASPASSLAAVEVAPAGEGVLLHLMADGIIGETSSFTLDDPDRLVVDLPGLQSGVSQDSIAVDLPQVSRVRIGAHPDKVRVVIDGGAEARDFEGRRLMPASNGLFVTVGSGEALDQALAAAMAASGAAATRMAAAEEEISEDGLEMVEEVEVDVAEAEVSEADLVDDQDWTEVDDSLEMDEPAVAQADAAGAMPEVATLATVHGIHFDSQQERDRIVVLSEGLVQYEALYPDPESMVLSISGATIPRDAEGRITPTPGGPVSLITAFQQPDVETPEVRVVVKRAADLEPEITRRGEIVFIDFPHTGMAAAAPPAFAGTAQMTANGAPAPMGGVTPVAADTAALAVPESPQGGESGMTAMGDEAGSYDELASQPASLDGLEGVEMGDMPEIGQPAAIDVSGMDAPSLEPMGPGAPAALEPPAAVDMLEEGGLIDGKEYEGRRISLDFKDVEIADVLRIIAEVSDLNIVAGEEVTGKVTIRLVDVPWDQALDVILLTKGLGFVRVGNVLRIAPADILAQEEEIRLQERRNKEKLEDLVVKLHPVNYAAVNDVKNLVQRLLSSRGTVNIDERTNTVILKDIASVIDEASALINAIDTQTPQVMIEAKIVEAALDFSRELGTVWSIGTNPLQDGFSAGSDPRKDLGTEDFLFHDENSVIFSNPITSLASGLASLNAFILDEKIDLGVSLAAAESSGDGKVISSPRVVTLDNREAEIEQGVSIPFQTFENGDAKLEFIDAVLRLKVTPHITADKSIIMKLEVERNAPDDSVQTPTGSPAIAKNEAKTETLVKDGQTLVIGGIYTVVRSQRESRVPYLHMIPFIGNAFKSREVTDQRKELLIFVTPRVVLQPNAA